MSPVEVTNVSSHGFWLFISQRELFVAFRDFPWLKEASIAAITRVELPSPHHLYWPDLDVDLAVESIEHPEIPAAEPSAVAGLENSPGDRHPKGTVNHAHP